MQYSSNNNDRNPIEKLTWLISFLSVASFVTAICSFVSILFITDLIIKAQLMGICVSMTILFLTIFTFIKLIVPKDMEDEINKMLDEEAEEKAKEILLEKEINVLAVDVPIYEVCKLISGAKI